MNISPELYEKWESGEVVPTVDVLPRLSLCFGFYLCDAFMGISIDEFFVPQKEKMNMGETLRVLEEFAHKLEESGYTWFNFPEEFGRKAVAEAMEMISAQYGNTVLYSSARSAYAVKRMERILTRAVLTMQDI